jgi:glycosyltransferase involved in cell wall biosynthesis
LTNTSESASHPLVSVVVPTFNRTLYLAEALESALAQVDANLEILVSDDASAEDVGAFVRARFSDPRVHYHRNPTNLGMGLNCWGALSRASGKYVTTLHDDDAWEPDFLASLVPALEDDATLSVAYCDHAIMREDSRVDAAASDLNTRLWHRDALARGVLRPMHLYWKTIPAAMAAVFRKSAIDWSDFPAAVGTHYDLWLSYLASRTGAGAWYEPRRLTRYRVHGQSETASWQSTAGKLRALRQTEFILRRQLQDEAFASIRPQTEALYVRTVVSLALTLLEEGLGDESRALLQGADDLLARRELKLAVVVAGAVAQLATHVPCSVLKRSISTARLLRGRFLDHPSARA